MPSGKFCHPVLWKICRTPSQRRIRIHKVADHHFHTDNNFIKTTEWKTRKGHVLKKWEISICTQIRKWTFWKMVDEIVLYEKLKGVLANTMTNINSPIVEQDSAWSATAAVQRKGLLRALQLADFSSFLLLKPSVLVAFAQHNLVLRIKPPS